MDRNTPERQALVEQVLDATTLIEIRLAADALHTWIAEHPEDSESLADGFEQLANMEEIATMQSASHVAAS
jgi:hypothetical protein